uniref:Uncharacterized protein n=1 Tax=Rhizophora mucronata TaxID=61149 RepID=A0A2P2QRH9_RHIMU
MRRLSISFVCSFVQKLELMHLLRISREYNIGIIINNQNR